MTSGRGSEKSERPGRRAEYTSSVCAVECKVGGREEPVMLVNDDDDDDDDGGGGGDCVGCVLEPRSFWLVRVVFGELCWAELDAEASREDSSRQEVESKTGG